MESPSCDVMWYIPITPPLLALFRMDSIFAFWGGISIKFVISRFLLDVLFWRQLWYRAFENVGYNIHWVFLLWVVLDGIWILPHYLVQVPFICEPDPLDYVYHVSIMFVHCTCLPLGLLALKHAKKTFSTILNRFLVTLYALALIGLARVSNTNFIFLANITTAGLKADGAFP